jgi:hypothetical protein
MMPCSLVEIYRYFGGSSGFKSKPSNQSAKKQTGSGTLLSSLLVVWKKFADVSEERTASIVP